jgi:hypothetical protein
MHERLFDRFGFNVDSLLKAPLFELCTAHKVFPPEFNKQQTQTMEQTSVVWLSKRKHRKIVIPAETPKCLTHLMIVYQYAKNDMLRNHPGRRLTMAHQPVVDLFEQYFKSLTRLRSEKEKRAAASKAGILGLFFSFYLFLILHELQYECKDRTLSAQDHQAISLWKTHLELMMQWQNKRERESFNCFPTSILSQQLIPLVYTQAKQWNFIQSVRSTLALLASAAASTPTSFSCHLNDDNNSSDCGEDEDEEKQDKQQDQGEQLVDASNNAEEEKRNSQIQPRGKNVVYQFERIAPKR